MDWQRYLQKWKQTHTITIPPNLKRVRDEFVQRFPKEELHNLTLENYALGNPEKNPDSFSTWIEFKTKQLGSIAGGSSSKHGIYWSKQDKSWRWSKFFDAKTAAEAFEQIRSGFVKLILAVEANRLDDLDEIADNYFGKNSNVLRGKPLYLYYPEKFIPIFAIAELDSYLSFFGLLIAGRVLAKNLKLYNYLKSLPEFEGFDSWGIMHFLYSLKRETNVIYEPLEKQNSKSWFFQCRPDFFDLQGALQELDHLTWLVKQHKQDIKKGDLVFLWESGKEAGIVALGNVVSEVEKIEQDPQELVFNLDSTKFSSLQDRVRIKVNQVLEHKLTKEGVKEYPELSDLSILHFAQGTNFKVKEYEANFLLSLIYEKQSDHNSLKFSPKYTLENLQETTGIELVQFIRLIQNFRRKKQIIFTGSPGTGKTFLVAELAKYLVSESDGFIEIIQFHPAYTYEDFIQGLRPLTDIDGNLRYEIVLGRFSEFCEKARGRDDNCVLIIDEINRANLSAVFGELMYLLEYRDQEIKLAGSNEPFSIPENVYIIGTMNTADRSIALVDHALRRRFAFIELRPDYNILRKWHEREETGFDVEPLITQIEKVNESIGDRHYHLGISYFLDAELTENIADIWEMEIYPYLEELFYGEPEKLEQFTWENIKSSVLGEAEA